MGRPMNCSGQHHRSLRSTIAVLAFVGTLIGLAAVAGATEPSAAEVSRITSDVSESIESPYCPGQTLAMCPSANAAYTRQDIQEMAEQGMDADEIKAELVERYGEGYELIEPPISEQMTLLGGIIGGLVVAVGVVGFLARRKRDDDGNPVPSDGSDDDDTGPGEDDPYLEELRAEVRD